jgi:rubrerythrin
MKLSNKQKELLKEKLDKQTRFVCPVCGQGHIAVSDRLFELREFEGGNLIVGGGSSLIPLIVLTCQNCGHVFFLNAIALGILKNEGKENDSAKK